MPTTARLIAAFCLVVIAWIVSKQVMGVMPPETQFGSFVLVNLVIAALCGWIVIGSRVGTDYVTSLSIGLTGVVVMVFWGLFVQAFNEMLRLALARRYDGPLEAVVDIFQLAINFGANLIHLHILGVLFVGGLVTGVVVEFVNRRWS